uniref:Fibrinogen-like protein 1-like n=1 Tax=Saccoglossus kowalevskii TaxID=10224 RepID=A0ABM0MXZ7_SACKO|nr:PREDICTED: fibrinogen-like protein 1-like [Saccoglossus kowalevskii]
MTVISQSTTGQRGMTSYQYYCNTSTRCQYTLTLPDCGNEKDCNGKDDQPTLTQLIDIVMQLSNKIEQLNDQILALNDRLTQHNEKMSESIQNIANDINRLNVKDCDSILDVYGRYSGVYELNPIGMLQPFDVYCEMTESGAWTVIQRRQDGSVDFYRNWADYKVGFGNTDGEYWIGNDKIYRLTHQASYKLRIDLEKFDGNTSYAEYDTFWIENENNNYTLHLGQYSGTAGDAMRIYKNLDGQPFSTYDRDNDIFIYNCASSWRGAWWFRACASSHLNGLYFPQVNNYMGIVWKTWYSDTLKSATMKIQKTD